MPVQKLISLPPGMVGHFHGLEQKNHDEWYCGSDPVDHKVGSGGGTASLLASAYRDEGAEGNFEDWLPGRKRLVIHSGGESRRLPAYAPYGKAMMPMPVFRWSKGQYIDQKLLEFQAAYYERILSRAPASYCTLIGTGDVLIISEDRFNKLPEADVLLFGVWVEDAVAEKHGVFFSRKEKQDQLAFVKQKPSGEELRKLGQEYYYLMDSGIVLMNAATTLKLMQKSGWNARENHFEGGSPGFYDLYSDMLTCFGPDAEKRDADLSELDVKLVPLREGEFYHFGSSRDMLESTLKLQNRIQDQRLKYTRENSYHPSIFQQNAQVDFSFGKDKHHLWIENSHLASGWVLDHHHVITGVPMNKWKLELPAHICLDMVPLAGQEYGLRIYHFGDLFQDSPPGEQEWLGQKLKNWLADRSLEPGRAGINMDLSIMDQALFPVVEPGEVPALVQFIVHGAGDEKAWLQARRLSARELARHACPGTLNSQREAMKSDSLPRLASNHLKSIFYYLDLQKTAADYRHLGLDLPRELPEDEAVIKRINDRMFRSRVTGNGALASRYEDEAFSILREALIGTLKSQPVEPRKKVLEDQILWGRSPVRLDLAGGWTDTPPYCIMEGGKVVNMSVELNGQLPLQVYARPLEEHLIVLRSIDLGQKAVIRTFEELKAYDQVGGVFSIPLAALVLAGFGPEFSARAHPDLAAQLKAFGCGIELSLLAAIPKGSGLGTSSNLAATVLGTLNEFCDLNWDRHEVAYRTLILEQMLTSGGGWQDQFGGIFEGVKLLETSPGLVQRPSIKWLPQQLFSRQETREMILLYYTGVTRVARDILGEIVKGMFLNSAGHLGIFSEMQEHARGTFETMLRNDYEGLAARVALSWDLNQRLDEGTNPPVIQEITRQIEDYLLGYKLLGAGGGGYLMMFAKSAEAALKVRKEMEDNPPNPRARFVKFRVSSTGFQVSRS